MILFEDLINLINKFHIYFYSIKLKEFPIYANFYIVNHKYFNCSFSRFFSIKLHPSYGAKILA